MAAELAARIDRGLMPGAEQNLTGRIEPRAERARREDDPADLARCMKAVARGDERALAALYDATVSRVYGLALRITRNAQCAEDVVNETFLKVWKNAAGYSPARGPVLAWLLVIARSRAIDLLRDREPAQLHSAPEEDYAEQVAFDCDPHDLLQATRSHRALHAAMTALEPRERQLIALAFFRGLSHTEIAQHAGLPLGTVKTMIRRSMQALRDALPADLANAS